MKIQYSHGFGFTAARQIVTDWNQMEVPEDGDIEDYVKTLGVKYVCINGVYFILDERLQQTNEYFRQKNESILFYDFILDAVAEDLSDLGVKASEIDDLIEVYGYSSFEADALSDRIGLIEQNREDFVCEKIYQGR